MILEARVKEGKEECDGEGREGTHNKQEGG